MQSFNIGKYVWSDVSGIPGNTVIYVATSLQKLKTGKKKKAITNPSDRESRKSSYPRCFHNVLHKITRLIFPFI